VPRLRIRGVHLHSPILLHVLLIYLAHGQVYLYLYLVSLFYYLSLDIDVKSCYFVCNLLKTHLGTNSTVHGLRWKYDNFLTGQEIPRFYGSQTFITVFTKANKLTLFGTC